MKLNNVIIYFALILIIFSLTQCEKRNKIAVANNPFPTLGGDFELTDHNGKSFNLKDHRGKIILLFFGYTRCPDACPIAMQRIMNAYNTLDKMVIQQVQPIFVSVDKNDTPELLKTYISYFDMNAIGLTGSPEKIKEVAKKYGVFYKINTAASSTMDYLIDHTTRTFIIGKNGKIQFLFKHEQTAKELAEIIEALAIDS